MKATLRTILLSLLLTAGLTSCTQSDNSKEIAEIQEAIEANEKSQAREKIQDEIRKKTARLQEMENNRLEKLASTPEGRAQMKEEMLIFKHCYVENNHLILKLSKAEALQLGISAECYDGISASFQQTNNNVDSLMALSSESANCRINHSSLKEAFDGARNGTHRYYKYLKKYYSENPEIPALRKR